MKDITSITGGDLMLIDTQVSKGANILQTQIGDLEYAPDFGIDIEFFLSEDFQFQNESFKSYLIQRLSEQHVNVSQVLETLERLYLNYTFVVAEPESTGGMIR